MWKDGDLFKKCVKCYSPGVIGTKLQLFSVLAGLGLMAALLQSRARPEPESGSCTVSGCPVVAVGNPANGSFAGRRARSMETIPGLSPLPVLAVRPAAHLETATFALG